MAGHVLPLLGVIALLAMGVDLAEGSYVSKQPVDDILWPKPLHLETGFSTARIVPQLLRVTLSPPHAILEQAILRYTNQHFFPFPADKHGAYFDTGVLRLLEIRIESVWMHPRLGSDAEAYEIKIYHPEGSEDYAATIEAEGYFGALRGLETFSQLIQVVGQEHDQVTSHTPRYRYQVSQVPLAIADQPSVAWRGVMISASQSSSVKEVKEILDVMSWMKMNVLHWCLTDDESFAFLSDTWPELARGASSPQATFNTQQIKEIVDYATDRGIYVIPEIDIPAHAASWTHTDLNITVECEGRTQLEVASVDTYVVLEQLFAELDGLFPEGVPFHIGGRDLDLDCWGDKSVLLPFWDTHFLRGKATATTKALGDYFYQQVFPMLTKLHRTGIVWDDLMALGLDIPSQILIQGRGSEQTLLNAVNFGYEVIAPLSNEGAEDQSSPYGDNNQRLERLRIYANAVGAESLFWSPKTKGENPHSVLWPQVARDAASLWTTNHANAIHRQAIDSWLCRAHRRGALLEEGVSEGVCGVRSPDLVWSVNYSQRQSTTNQVEFFLYEEDYEEEYVPPSPSPKPQPVKKSPVSQPSRVSQALPSNGHPGLAGVEVEPNRAQGYLLWLSLLLGGGLFGTAVVRRLKGLPFTPFLVAGWIVLSLVAISRIM